MTNDNPGTIILRWPSDAAELNLGTCFPATRTEMAHIQKLLRLDPDAAPDAARRCLECINGMLTRLQDHERDTYRRYMEHRQIAADATERVTSGRADNGLPLNAAQLKAEKDAARDARRKADRDAAEVRRTQRDIKRLRENAATIQHWTFTRNPKTDKEATA